MVVGCWQETDRPCSHSSSGLIHFTHIPKTFKMHLHMIDIFCCFAFVNLTLWQCHPSFPHFIKELLKIFSFVQYAPNYSFVIKRKERMEKFKEKNIKERKKPNRKLHCKYFEWSIQQHQHFTSSSPAPAFIICIMSLSSCTCNEY